MSKLSCAVVGYIPRANIAPKVCSPQAFVENITRFKTRYPCVFYTDGKWDIAEVTIRDPEPIPNRDAKLKNGWPNYFVLNNLIFFTGLRIALARGFTHIIYLEADCRVGRDHWDEELFDFHFRHPVPLVCSGTAVAFNVCTAGRDPHIRWRNWVNEQKAIPGYEALKCAVYGWRGQSTTDNSPMPERPTVFVNGALGVYDTAWLKKIFGMDGLPAIEEPSATAAPTPPPVSEWASRLGGAPVAPPVQSPTTGTKDNCKQLAETTFAWDFAIGYELWKMFESHCFEQVANNPRVYSGFGDVMTTEAERMQMLKDGTICAVHQIKSSATL